MAINNFLFPQNPELIFESNQQQFNPFFLHKEYLQRLLIQLQTVLRDRHLKIRARKRKHRDNTISTRNRKIRIAQISRVNSRIQLDSLTRLVLIGRQEHRDDPFPAHTDDHVLAIRVTPMAEEHARDEIYYPFVDDLVAEVVQDVQAV